MRMGGKNHLIIMADIYWEPILYRHCTQPSPDISFKPHSLTLPVLQKKEWKLTEF